MVKIAFNSMFLGELRIFSPEQASPSVSSDLHSGSPSGVGGALGAANAEGLDSL
jgi:hypothetical protein